MTILHLASTDAILPTAGGKGANLARLAGAGFPVPQGFIIPTDAYRAFVNINHLAEVIGSSIKGLAEDDAERLERASGRIRAAFSTGKIPGKVESNIRTAHTELSAVPVAVRSSATAEDLPDLSFAGQQDTFLNILGEEQLLEAVIDCWSSLWTARAIGYRMRNAIDHDEAALAVVVQEMVQSDVSGVLFTANPLTGLLSESAVEATFGLGEALVSGQVEPDHFVVDALTGQIITVRLGGKNLSTRARVGGGVETVVERAQDRQTLSDSQIRQLVSLGQLIEEEFGAPQDIEWSFAAGELYILQSRPITSLFPVPELSFDPLLTWFSFGAVQGLLTPITPLGQDTIKTIAAGSGTMFGLQLRPDEQKVFAAAGERLWIRLGDFIRHPIGHRIYGPLLRYIEPGSRLILEKIAADPRFGAGTGKIKISTLARLARFFLPMLPRLLHCILRPENRRTELDAQFEAYLAAAYIAPASDRFGSLANIVAYMRHRIGNVFSFALPKFIPVLGPSMAALNLLDKIAGDNNALVLEVTRSLPGNVTTQMDMELWGVAAEIREDAGTSRLFLTSDVETLTRGYLNDDLPPAAESWISTESWASMIAPIARFMDKYGMRGVGEIDLGQPRWREEPAPIFRALQSYLAIEEGDAPDALFAAGEVAAHAAIETLAAQARLQPAGRLKEKLVRATTRRIRFLMGARESAKFFAIRTMGIARAAILNVGQEFVEAGTITQPDDLFYLRLSELEALSRDEPRDWQALVAQRRAIYQRELRRRQIPRILLSDGRAFYEGLGADTASNADILGSPVSPGTVEGVVHVVLDPKDARLAPGEILVCPGTDPAWTPLLMAAGGLVTEVGGLMTHGSVVARELGIPAVVSVHNATERLKTGQTIRVDGTTGKISMLSP